VCYVFREIRNKSWWDKSHDELPWLKCGELVADVFKGLVTKKGGLSTYLIDEDKSNLDRVLAAFACTQESIQRVDYVLIPMDRVLCAFKVVCIPGDTADDLVNSWHCDVVELTSHRAEDFARLIDDNRDSMVRVLPKDVKNIVCNARDQRNIDCDLVNQKLKPKLEKICS
jgi:hypothetical protein